LARKDLRWAGNLAYASNWERVHAFSRRNVCRLLEEKRKMHRRGNLGKGKRDCSKRHRTGVQMRRVLHGVIQKDCKGEGWVVFLKLPGRGKKNGSAQGGKDLPAVVPQIGPR